MATLYQESNGLFQEKTAKLILRRLKKSKLLGNVYKGLGVVTLRLNSLMQDLLTSTSKTLTYPIDVLKGGASVNLTITARILNEGDEDDTASLLSDSSDLSVMGAFFDNTDDNNIPSMTSVGIGLQSTTLERRRSSSFVEVGETIVEADDEDNDEVNDDGNQEKSLRDNLSSVNNPGSKMNSNSGDIYTKSSIIDIEHDFIKPSSSFIPVVESDNVKDKAFTNNTEILAGLGIILPRRKPEHEIELQTRVEILEKELAVRDLTILELKEDFRESNLLNISDLILFAVL